jgi:hypothetical protein
MGFSIRNAMKATPADTFSPKRGTFQLLSIFKDHFQIGIKQYFQQAFLLFHSHNSISALAVLIFIPTEFTQRITVLSNSSFSFV